ncbi:MAG: outer membrane beta-barrel protein [Pseudomonadota bacterium]
MKSPLASVSALALFVAQPALSQSIDPSTIDWSGSYAGISFNAGILSSVGLMDGGAIGGTEMVVAPGVQAGYFWQKDNVVTGLELSLQDGGYEGDHIHDNEYDFLHESEWEWLLNISAKKGIATGSALFYATAGVTVGQHDFATCYLGGDTFCDGDDSESAYFDDKLIGFNVGIGAMYALSDKWSLGAEYNIIGFPSKYDVTLPDGSGGENTEATSIAHSLNLSFNYHFGGLETKSGTYVESYNWAGTHVTLGAVAGMVETHGGSEYGAGFGYEAAVAPFIGVQRYIQSGDIVKGISLDLIGPGLSAGVEFDGTLTGDPSYMVESEWNWTASLQGRVGIASGNALIYATAGLAMTNATIESFEDDCSSSNDNCARFDGNLFGIVGGAGVAFAVSDRSSLSVEYNYYRFQSKDVTADFGGSSDDGLVSLGTAGHILKLGYAYKLGQAQKQQSAVENADWSGTYGGISGNLIATNVFTNGYYGATVGTDSGVALTAQLGRNWQNGSFVYGLEASVTSGHSADAETGDTADNYYSESKWNWSASLTARAGIATGDILLYAKVGVTAADVDIVWCDDVPCEPGDSDTSRLDGVSIGFTGGIGAAYALDSKSSVFVEYLHTGLADRFTDTTFGGDPGGYEADKTSSTDQLRVGYNWKF